jgi:Uma2 family endonuclease
MVQRAKVRFLATDIWETPDDGKRYEVIDGDLYVTPPPSWGHQVGVGGLYYLLAGHVRARELGYVVPAPVGVVLDEHNGIQPDIVFVSRGRSEIIQERGVFGSPDLVVEFLSPSTRSRDRTVKKRRYAAAGVPHYWMGDPRTRMLETHRLRGDVYQLTGTYGPGDIYRPELFPGLAIPIDEIWK